MKRVLLKTVFLQLFIGTMLMAGCDDAIEDIVPASFNDFKLFPDEIYTFNSNNGWILRLDPLANDSLKTEAVVTYSQPVNGELFPNFDGPGTMGYKPKNNYFGLDSLTYTVCTKDLCKTEKITLIVEQPFDPVTCVTSLAPDSLETTRNTPKGIRIFLNDIVCYNDKYGGTEIRSPEKGTFNTIDYSGSYKNTIYMYYPPKNFVGQDSFRYKVYTSRDRSTFQEIVVKVTVK
ncbi:Ig-like domain-containing protein [Pontibacter locisalis]|uniref:Ig-like domain-containing protein n=1 Tax=Pontibacter locisalis TaxID=1719035 RepID=A0ABW5IPH4_9BACT